MTMYDYLSRLSRVTLLAMIEEYDELEKSGVIGEGVLREHARRFAEINGVEHEVFERATQMALMGLNAAMVLVKRHGV